MIPEFQRVRDRELIERIGRSDAALGQALARLDKETRFSSPIDLALERRILGLPTYRSALRAWRDEPGPALTWGRFEVLGELGRGMGGVVYAARLEGDTCALKVLRTSLAESDSAMITERFLREIDLLGRLDHPGIVRLLGAGAEDGVRYHATEFVEGGSLLDAARTTGPSLALKITVHVSRALRYAHEAGVIHRDLKPQNVLMALDGRPRLVDFGLAKDLEATSLTHSDAFLGTALYAAPEQIAGAKYVDVRADVYGLGGVLYFLLSGHPPHQARNMGEWLASAREPVAPLHESPGLEGRALEAVNALLIRALSPRAEDRHPSVDAFLTELQATRS